MYIGSAFTFKSRWKNHIVELRLNRHHSPYLQASFNKYGEESFIFIVLEYVDDLLVIVKHEQIWLDKYKVYDREFGYNVCSVAGNKTGVKASPQTLGKLSLLRKGVPRSEETKRKIAESWKTRVVSDEAKRNMSLAHMGKKPSEETKIKMSLSKLGNKINTGRKQSKEEIEKRANSNRGRKRSEEAKAKMSARQTGRKISEEAKRNMSIAAKKRWGTLDNSLDCGQSD